VRLEFERDMNVMSNIDKINQNAVQRANERTDSNIGAASVFRADDDDEDVGYWLSRTPEERLAAQEINRQVLYGYEVNETSTRIQGVFEIFRATSR
jgi:hypothetical protein